MDFNLFAIVNLSENWIFMRNFSLMLWVMDISFKLLLLLYYLFFPPLLAFKLMT